MSDWFVQITVTSGRQNTQHIVTDLPVQDAFVLPIQMCE